MTFGSIDEPVYFVNENNSYGKFGDDRSLVMAIIAQWSLKCFPSGNDFGIVCTSSYYGYWHM